MKEREITGKHVLIVAVLAFGLIIAVNVTLAWQAVATFPGLEVKNSYVASQTFDADRAAQEALGWTVTAEVEEDTLILSFTDRSGQPFAPEIVEATLGRATSVAEDRTPDFAFDGYALVAPVSLAPGYWNLRIKARAEDGTLFKQRLEIFLRPPA